MSEQRVKLLEQRFSESFKPSYLDIEDDSAKHAGHAGAKGGAGHFNVTIVSDAFADKNLVQRHRMVYAVVDDLMNSEIHALSIKAHTPDEYQG